MTARLRRKAAADYLQSEHNIPVTPKTLANYASAGGGPLMRFWGRIPLYEIIDLDAWVAERLETSVANTTEKRERAR